MDMATALAELGATETSVDAETRDRLDRDGLVAREALADQAAPHPDEVLLTAPAGTVVVFNSHLWHGGTKNRSDQPRRALHSYFGRRSRGQQLDQKKYARPETLARLSPAARFILDV